MKVFKLGDVYKDTFDVFAQDGEWGELKFEESYDGIFIMDVEDPSNMMPLSDNPNDNDHYILDYGSGSGYKGKVYFQLIINEGTGTFFVEGKLYKVVIFGQVGNDSEGWIRLNGTVVREFAVAPYGAVNLTHVDSSEVEEGDDSVGKINQMHSRLMGTTEIDFDASPTAQMTITYGDNTFIYNIFTGTSGDIPIDNPNQVITKMVLVE